jgi:uncharacterized RDD family membrane protein YckC/predicted secreted protein
MDQRPLGPLYATFPRRVRAMVLDSVVLVAALVIVVFLAATVHFGQSGRLALFAGLITVAILYEPIAVSFWGRTIGQRLCNLRVVAPTPNERLPFWKAFLRWLLKALTGLASFATMGATQRNQALHDLPFKTTVQIADPAKAGDRDFILERTMVIPGELPPRWRRALIIGGYWLLLFVLLSLGTISVASQSCIDGGRCEGAERRALQVIDTAWLAACIATALFGWQGRLLGARRRPARPAPLPSGPGVSGRGHR